MKTRTIYIIWHRKENRPAMMVGNFANLIAFLTFEQAQAYQYATKDDEGAGDFDIEEVKIDF